MDVAAIRDALHQQPFQPFRLRLVDGREVAIPHPDYVAVSKRQVIVVNSQDESVVWLEPLLIVSLDFAAKGQSTPPTGNGS